MNKAQFSWFSVDLPDHGFVLRCESFSALAIQQWYKTASARDMAKAAMVLPILSDTFRDRTTQVYFTHFLFWYSQSGCSSSVERSLVLGLFLFFLWGLSGVSTGKENSNPAKCKHQMYNRKPWVWVGVHVTLSSRMANINPISSHITPSHCGISRKLDLRSRWNHATECFPCFLGYLNSSSTVQMLLTLITGASHASRLGCPSAYGSRVSYVKKTIGRWTAQVTSMRGTCALILVPVHFKWKTYTRCAAELHQHHTVAQQQVYH